MHVALIHYPVVNRKNEIIGSAVTNLDLHDIARASKTYGVATYWVVTPDVTQQHLVSQIFDHWTTGHGCRVNPDRAAALSLIRICSTLDEVIDNITGSKSRKKKPLVVATSACGDHANVSFPSLRQELDDGGVVVLLFGTAWGLAPSVMDQVDLVLPPVKGAGTFNHLSVRSAVSIVLDRLLGCCVDE